MRFSLSFAHNGQDWQFQLLGLLPTDDNINNGFFLG
jgi:hypothetical protein